MFVFVDDCVLQEALKSAVNVIELVGLQYTFTLTPGMKRIGPNMGILAVGIGSLRVDVSLLC